MEKEPIWTLLRITASITDVLDGVGASETKELATTLQNVRNVLTLFVSKRPDDPAFDVCVQSLRVSLEKTAESVNGYVAAAKSGGRESNAALLELAKLDFLVKQKCDQMQFLFTSGGEAVAKLSNEPARAMWSNAFGKNVKMVPWAEFVSVLVNYSGEKQLMSEFDLETLKQFVDFTRDEWVSTYELEVFLLSFGPLVGSASRLLSAFKSGILSGYTPAMEASALLQGRDAGCFLIRFSKSNPGAFAVTFVDSKLRIKHCLLYCAKPHGVTLRDPPDVFPTLEAFLRAHQGRLQTPMGGFAERFRPSDAALVAGDRKPYSGALGSSYSMAMNYLDDEEETPKSSKKLCVVCFNSELEAIFLPCGHCCTCMKCGTFISQTKEPTCPICRSSVEKVQKFFLVN